MSLHNMQDKLQRGELINTFSGFKTPAGLMLGWGTTVGNGIQGWAPGAIFIDTDATAGAKMNINSGTISAASWKVIPSTDVAQASANFENGISLAGVTVDATAAEINRAADKSASVVTVGTTTTVLAVTVTAHASRTIVLNSATTCTVSMPAAAGTGEKFTIVVNVLSTDGNKVIAANGTDVMKGQAVMCGSTQTTEDTTFKTSASSDKVTLNGTTQGGIVGTILELIDIAANTWQVKVLANASGTALTPFSES